MEKSVGVETLMDKVMNMEEYPMMNVPNLVQEIIMKDAEIPGEMVYIEQVIL